jgi:hypothetical protein
MSFNFPTSFFICLSLGKFSRENIIFYNFYGKTFRVFPKKKIDEHTITNIHRTSSY